MDRTDSKMLQHLLHNSRQSYTQIARDLHISVENARYRHLKLEKGVVGGYYTMIDWRRLGYERHLCYVALQGMTKEKEDAFLSYLIKHRFISFIGRAIGKWDVAFEIFVQDINELYNRWYEINSEWGGYVEDYVMMSAMYEIELFPEKFLPESDKKGSPNHFRKLRGSSGYEKLSLDEIDMKILNNLSFNPRVNYVSLSAELSMTANAIRQRIRRLEKNGLIIQYSLFLDYSYLDYTLYNIQVRCRDISNIENLKSMLRGHLLVSAFYHNIGNENWDLEINVAVKDITALQDFLTELKGNYASIIVVHDVFVFSGIWKMHIPDGVFEYREIRG